jgi:hypothetical protein
MVTYHIESVACGASTPLILSYMPYLPLPPENIYTFHKDVRLINFSCCFSLPLLLYYIHGEW